MNPKAAVVRAFRPAVPAVLIVLLAVPATAQVPYSRIVRAESEPQSWLTYAGSYKSQRFSQLDQINRQNVSTLKPAWVYQLKSHSETASRVTRVAPRRTRRTGRP